jgi:hypothetical protein
VRLGNYVSERLQVLPVHVWHDFTIAGGPAGRKFSSRDFRTLPELRSEGLECYR